MDDVVGRDIFIRGGPRGALPPLNFDNPKRSKIVYVACGTIIHRVVAAAKCKSLVIDRQSILYSTLHTETDATGTVCKFLVCPNKSSNHYKKKPSPVHNLPLGVKVKVSREKLVFLKAGNKMGARPLAFASW